MLTAKLAGYTQADCDFLAKQVHRLVISIYELHNCDFQHCDECPMKVPCDDLCLLLDFLMKERIKGYPHCKTETHTD